MFGLKKKEKKDPNTLEVQVYEDVGISEIHPGGGRKKEPTREEILKLVLERKVALSSLYVMSHNKKSRKIENKDLERVLKDAQIMHEMCLVGRGDYNSAYAVAHSQIDDKDPLRFYVTTEGQIIVNPVIFNHTNYFTEKKEGCLSNPDEPMKIIKRFHKIQMRYQNITQRGGDKKTLELSPILEINLNGTQAEIVQHELDHCNGSNIYFESFTSYDCLGEK